ncbi:MAG: phage holin family protein [Armatimonadetes bacterium]|nr:phage holin family protein [Armatimonadota bacterium]
MRTEGDGEPIPTILRRLLSNVAALLQIYAVQAGEEARATVRDVVIGVMLLGVAAVLGVLVLAMMVVTAVLALAAVLAPWQAAVIVLDVTALLMALAAAIGLGRLRRRRLGILAAAFKEDLRWLRSTLLESD